MRLLIGTVSLNTKPLTEIWLRSLYESITKSSLDICFPGNDPVATNCVQVVVVDNGSTDGVMDLSKEYPWVTFIRNEKNEGVARAWNQLIKQGFDDTGMPLCDYYFPANNDLVFTLDWVDNMVKCLLQDTKNEFGWISSFMNDYKEPDLTGVTETVQLEGRYWGGLRPEADDVVSKQQMDSVVKTAYAPWGGIDKFAALLVGKYGIKLKEMHPKAPMFCLSKECIKKVGLFDEYNSPVGIHEDADYCQRIKQYSNFKFGAAFGAYVHHFSMMTRTKKEFKDKWVEEREAAFTAKWGHSSKEMHLIPADYGMKLDIGSGERPHEGPNWYHMDIDRQFKDLEFLHDCSKELPFDDGKLQEIYCSNNLEHISWKDTLPVLFDWGRCLKPGGKIHIRVPNFRFLAEQYLAGRWKLSLVDGTDLNVTHAIWGGDHPGCPHIHKVGFDFANLSDALKSTGFTDIKDVSDQGSWELRIEGIKQ